MEERLKYFELFSLNLPPDKMKIIFGKPRTINNLKTGLIKMKKQTKSNLPVSLQSLGIIFLVFFAMAFACRDENNQTPVSEGSCSTEAEFLKIFKRDQLSLSTSPNEYKPPEVDIKSFEVGSPFTHKDVYRRAGIDDLVEIYPAYPVKVSWTLRVFRYGNISEDDMEGGLFYCFKNPEDNKKLVSQDPRFPKDACVCVGQNLPSTGTAARQRSCRYDEDDPNKTCPPTN